MSTIELRSNLHELINNIENPKLLESLYHLLSQRQKAQAGSLWENLTENQENEVMEAYKESDDPENLIEHTEILRRFK